MAKKISKIPKICLYCLLINRKLGAADLTKGYLTIGNLTIVEI